MRVQTIAEERRRFKSVAKQNEKRLEALISSRLARQDSDDRYRIGPGDRMDINVFDVPELDVAVRVEQSGEISLPLIGDVRAAGLTEQELVIALNQQLNQFVIDPQTSVFVSEYGSKKISIVGAVHQPGSFALKKGGTTLQELVGEAGGVKEKADNFVQFLPAEFTRMSEVDAPDGRARFSFASGIDTASSQSSIKLPLARILGTDGRLPLNIPLLPGDMLLIPAAGTVQVDGEVKEVGAFDISRNLTLLGAIAAAGGITYGANIHEIELIREIGEGQKLHYVVDMTRLVSGDEDDLLLQSGDIVRVPSDSGRRMAQDTFEGISKLINVGLGGSFNMLP